MTNYNEVKGLVEELLQKESSAEQISSIVSENTMTQDDLLNQIGLGIQRR